jgi:hypothetical protein
LKFFLIIIITLLHLSAEEELFYNSLIWKKLLHNKNDKFLITSKDFYLSEQNNISLKNEYELTLNKFKSIDGFNFVCKYPSRYLIMKQNNIDIPNYNLFQCSELNSYVKDLFKDEVYLVIYDNVINNLNSQFGHVSLVFKNKNETFDSSNEIEVLANSKNDFLYIYNAFSGKYEKKFYKKNFYKNMNEAVIKDRDLYLYKLNINNFEKILLVYHLYEIRNSILKYYYLNENCTSPINDILSLIDENKQYTKNVVDLPSELAKIYANKIDSFGSITKKDYYENFPIKRLTEEEKSNYLRAILNFEKNYEAVNNIPLNEYKKTNENYISSPSSFQFAYIKKDKENGVNLEYTYYDMNISSYNSNLIENLHMHFLKFNFNFNNKSLILENLDLLNLNKINYSSKLSYDGYFGFNRNNKDSDLLFNSEVGLGIPEKFDYISFEPSLYIGLDEGEAYLKPKFNFKIVFDDKNILETYWYKKLYSNEDDYNNLTTSYIHDFKKISLIVSYINTNAKYENQYILKLKYKF